MHAYFRNHQLYLAEKFNWLDVQVTKNSKRALMKIESLKLLIQSDDSVEQTALVEKLVKDTLLTPVSNKLVLRKEGFFLANLSN
jgi:protein involved in polysaccharide export with SLBB domain